MTTLEVPRLKRKLFEVTIVGDTPLICNNFSEKARSEIRGKQAKRAKTRELRNPEAEALAATYQMKEPGAYGFPASAFKAAAVRAAKGVSNMTMIDTKGMFFIVADNDQLVGPLCYSRMEMKEDYVRLQGKSADLRYRYYSYDWKVDLIIEYDEDQISPEQIIFLLDKAGFSIGVGDWRPERGGNYGRFHVKKENE